MEEIFDFGNLINAHMEKQGLGDMRLASMVQTQFGHIVGISRGTIRHWRDGSKATDWRQLVAVAAALHLSTPETEKLLQAAELPGLTILWGRARDDEKELLQTWMEPAPVEMIGEDLAEIKDQLGMLAGYDEEILSQVTRSINGSREKKPASPPFILPPLNIQHFTGREEELQQLEQLLLTPDGPRVAGIAGLTGTGGMGKSALAIQFATIYKEQFPDGVIGLRVDGQQVDTLAQQFAHLASKEIDPKLELSAAEIMQAVFQEKRALLIFDNAEEAVVRDLLPGGSCCSVIVTTRSRGLLRSFGIPIAAQIDLPRFTFEETKRFLSQMLGEQGEQRVITELEAVQSIHTLVGGLPLALRIVGSVLQEMSFLSLTEYATMLQDEKEYLLRHLHDPNDPNLDVRVSFSLSLKFLNEDQKTLFACLGACAPEGFSLYTAQVVSNQNDITVKYGLGRLLSLSLIDQSTKTDRFALHPLLLLFARELAQEQHLLVEAEQRHTDYFIQYANEHRSFSPTDMDALETELYALLLTAQRLTNNQIADYHFYLSLEPFLQTRGYWSQALTLLDSLLDVARSQDDLFRITQLLLQKGQFYQLLARFENAEYVLDESKNIALQIENTWQHQHSLAMVLNSLGGVYQRQGKFEEAAQALRESHDLLVALGDERGQAMVLNSLGGMYQRQGKFEEAAQALHQSAVIEEKLGNQRGQAMVLNSLGGVYQRQGKFEEAEKTLQQSVVIEEKLGNQRGQAMVLNSLGGIYQRQGKFGDAVETLQESLELLVSLGDERGQAMALNSLGGVYQRQGKFEEAAQALRQSAIIEEELGNQRGQAMVLNSLGGVYQRQGKFGDAAETLQESYELLVASGDERGQAMALNSLGGVYQRQGKFEEAAQALRQSQAISEELKDQRSLAMVLNSLGGVYQRQGKFEEATQTLHQSRDLWTILGDKIGLAMVLNSLGGVYQRQGKFEEAAQALRQSQAISEELKDQRSLAMVLNSLGGVYQRQGKFEEAAQALERSLVLGKDMLWHKATVLNSLGGVYQRQGKFEEAAQTLHQSRDLWTILGDKIGLAMVLNSLGGVYQRQGKFEEATQALRQSQAIREELKDQRSLAMVLNSLGGVYQRQGKFEEAAQALRQSHDLLVALGDERGQAMVLNSLGGMYQKQGKFEEAIEAFQRSFALGKAETHSAMVLTSWGKALLDYGQPEAAVEKLKASFEIEERLRKVQGLRMVMSSLVRALTIMGQIEEAKRYCSRALAIAPDDKRLRKIQQQLLEPHQVSSQVLLKVGHIKRVIRNLSGYLYGFIIPDDESEDIYFGEGQVDAALLSQLAEGLHVKVEVEKTARGPRARRVWQNGTNQVLETNL